MDLDSVPQVETNSLPQSMIETQIAVEQKVNPIQEWYQACWKGVVKFLADQAWEDSDWED
jgi:hypothetical protein